MKRFCVLLITLLLHSTNNAQQPPASLKGMIDQINTLDQQETDSLQQFSDQWGQRIQTLQTTLASLSDSDQKTYQPQLTALQSQFKNALSKATADIQTTVQGAQKIISGLIGQVDKKSIAESAARNQAVSAITQAKQIIKDIFRTLMVLIDSTVIPLERSISAKSTTIQRQESITKARQVAAQKQEYQKKMRILYSKIGSIIPSLYTADTLARATLINELKSSINMQSVSSVTQKYSDIINQFVAVYKPDYTIDFHDASNYVTLTMKRLINFYLDDIAISHNKAQKAIQDIIKKKATKKDYYTILYNLAQRLQGTGAQGAPLVIASGYKAVIDNLASVFNQPQDAVLYYANKKNEMSRNLYINVLQDLVVTLTEPTQQDVDYAVAFYNEIVSDYPFTDANQLPVIQEQINVLLATAFINRGLASLKHMVAGKDNKQALASVIDSYTQASNYLNTAGSKYAATSAQYKSYASSLTRATGLRTQADSAAARNDTVTAITLYDQAQQNFAAGGDTIDAQDMHTKQNLLQANQNVAQGKKELTDFMNQNKQQLQAYMLFISSVHEQDIVKVSSFDSLINSLIDISRKALDDYNQAIVHYQVATMPVDVLQQSVSYLSSVSYAQSLLINGDILAQSGTIDDLNNAHQRYYNQALIELKNADSLYQQYPKIAEYVVVYPGLLVNDQLNQLITTQQAWNWVILGNRHIATVCSEVAQVTNDIGTKIQYFMDADKARSIYLSPLVDTYLTTTIKSFSGLTDQIQQMYVETQQREAAALQISAQEWIPEKNTTQYMSNADTIWRDIIMRYLSLYRLGLMKALEDYLRALNEYAQAYKSNVPSIYYPALGASMIYYHQYVLHVAANDQQSSSMVLKIIEELWQQIFDVVRSLEKKVDATDLLMSATDNQQQIIAWIDRFDQVIGEQKKIANDLVSLDLEQHVSIFKKSINDQTGDITYIIQPSGESLVSSLMIPNPTAKLAELYKKIGDAYFNQKNYRGAYPAYQQAAQLLTKLGKSNLASQADAQYKLSYTRAIADSYRTLVIPRTDDTHSIAMSNVGGVSVPEHYELFNYIQQIPPEIDIPLSMQTLAKDGSEQAMKTIQKDLLNIYYLMYMYNLLKDRNIPYSAVFSGNQVRSSFDVDPTQITLIQTLLTMAYQAEQVLSRRLDAQQSFLQIQVRKDAYGKDAFFLADRYQPIFAVNPIAATPMTQLPYRQFPTALMYYAWTQQLYDPTKPTISYGSTTLVSGNDKTIVDEMKNKMAQAYLAAGALYKKRIEFLRDGGNQLVSDSLLGIDEFNTLNSARAQIINLNKINKADSTINLSDYMGTYQLVKSYLQDVIATLYATSSDYYKQLNNTQNTQAITMLLGDTYKTLGDTTQLFLVGDPLSMNYFYGSRGSYGGLLWDVKQWYDSALGYYGKPIDQLNALYSQLGELFVQAGDAVVAQGKYFASLPYYQMAIFGAYKVITQPNQQKVTEANIKLFNAYYKGTTDLMMQYRAAKSSPITITSSTGEQEIVTFDELLARSYQADSAGYSTYKNFKDMLLDALIYYQDWSTQAKAAINAQSSSQSSSQTDAIMTAALDLIASYTKTNNIGLDTVASVSAWLMRDDFQTTLSNAFTQFSQKSLKASDQQNRAIGYAALGQWANNLFIAFGKIYMNDYLGGEQPADQFLKWMSDLSAEHQAIIAPAEQWLGPGT